MQVAGVGSQPGLAQETAREVRAATVRERAAEMPNSNALLEQWSRLFGVEAPAGKRVARLSVAVGKSEPRPQGSGGTRERAGE